MPISGRNASLSLDAEVRDLSAAQRQLVEIAKALALNANLIIFDEPTASLSPSEVERLFDVIARLEAARCAVVFVSHRLEEVFAITDEITVMREGRTVAASRPTASLNQAELVRLMVGRDLGDIYAAPPAVRRGAERPGAFRAQSQARRRWFATSPSICTAAKSSASAGSSGQAVRRPPETLFGLRPRAGGEVRLEGRSFSPRTPTQAIRAGLGFVAEDRRRQCIVPDLPCGKTCCSAIWARIAASASAMESSTARSTSCMARLELSSRTNRRRQSPDFSGGMQQKIIIARWLLLEPKVLILDEPTKGVDIGTRASIYAILRDIAAAGAAILVISSEFEELLGLADRVVVMSDGASIADVPSALLDEEKLTLLAAPRSSMERNQPRPAANWRASRTAPRSGRFWIGTASSA